MDTLSTIYTTTYTPTSSTDVFGIFAAVGFGTILIFMIVGLLINLALTWGFYKKAGYKGWEGVIPIYNTYCLYKIADVSMALFILSLFFPVINIYADIKAAEKFGKSAIWGVGLFFLGFIFYPILGYGDAVYQGKKPATAGSAPVEPITPATPAPETAEPASAPASTENSAEPAAAPTESTETPADNAPETAEPVAASEDSTSEAPADESSSES